MFMYKPNLDKPSIKQKQKSVEELKELSKDKSSIGIINLKHLPDNLFQTIRKEFRKTGSHIKVVKKPVAYRFLSGYKQFENHLDVCDEPIAFVFTNESPVKTYKIITGTRKKRPARPGDVAEKEIAVPAGETDLPPGPALSELKAAGLNVRVQGGKIAVAEDSIVAKPGDVINDKKAAALQKLGIMPFEVKAEMKLVFDGKYVYTPDMFKLTETLNDSLASSEKLAFNLSYNIKYPTPENLPMLLKEAYTDALSLAVNEELYSPVSLQQALGLSMAQVKALEPFMAKAEESEKEEKQENKSDEKSEDKKAN